MFSPKYFQVLSKFTYFLMLLSKPQVSFSSNFASLSSVMKGRLLSAWMKIHQIPFSLEATSQLFFKFWINLQCQKTQLLCTISAEILYTFNKRNLSRNKFGGTGSLKFVTLMDSFSQNNIKLQLKKVQKSYLSWHWRVMRSLKKNFQI